jgi:fumarylpyruvate hydrolase
MESVIPIPATPAIPVYGSPAVFPVRRIYCVGRNYADHAREMGGDPNREPPFFFGKPHDAVVPGGGDVSYPSCTSNLHYEVELVVASRGAGTFLWPGPRLHLRLCWHDLTRRDLRGSRKRGNLGHGQGFNQSAPIHPSHRSRRRDILHQGPSGCP